MRCSNSLGGDSTIASIDDRHAFVVYLDGNYRPVVRHMDSETLETEVTRLDPTFVSKDPSGLDGNRWVWWSIGSDELGHLHVLGGMEMYPVGVRFVPDGFAQGPLRLHSTCGGNQNRPVSCGRHPKHPERGCGRCDRAIRAPSMSGPHSAAGIGLCSREAPPRRDRNECFLHPAARGPPRGTRSQRTGSPSRTWDTPDHGYSQEYALQTGNLLSLTNSAFNRDYFGWKVNLTLFRVKIVRPDNTPLYPTVPILTTTVAPPNPPTQIPTTTTTAGPTSTMSLTSTNSQRAAVDCSSRLLGYPPVQFYSLQEETISEREMVARTEDENIYYGGYFLQREFDSASFGEDVFFMYQAIVGVVGDPDTRYCPKVMHFNGNFSEEALLNGNTDLHSGDRPMLWRSSLGIDEKGYLHASGNLNRWPRPASWPQGIPHHLRDAHVLYWRTSKPLDIHSFEFLGHDPDNAPPGFEFYATRGFNSGFWRFINDNEGRLYAFVPSADLDQPEEGLTGFHFMRFNTATMKWDQLGAEVPGRSAKVLMYEPVGADYTHMQCNFDRMDILQCVLSFDKQLYYARSCDYGETFYTSEGRKIELPMNPFDEAHTPEHVTRNLFGFNVLTSGMMKVNIYEDGTPFIVQRGDHTLESQPKNMADITIHGKNYETGKWEHVMQDFSTYSLDKRPENSHFMDKLGVTLADNHRRWLFKDFEENEDTLISVWTPPLWCDERYYKDTGNMMCFQRDGSMIAAVKTAIQRPIPYPAKWS